MRFISPIILFLFFSCFSCSDKKQVSPDEMQEINRTSTLGVGDKLKSFSGCPENQPCVSILDLEGKFTLLYFIKLKEDEKISVVFKLNEGIENKDLGKLVIQKKGNLIIDNYGEVAEAYGVLLIDRYKIATNTLFVADENKIITNIYTNVTEDDIIEIMNKLSL